MAAKKRLLDNLANDLLAINTLATPMQQQLSGTPALAAPLPPGVALLPLPLYIAYTQVWSLLPTDVIGATIHGLL